MTTSSSLCCRDGTVVIYLEPDPKMAILLPQKLLKANASHFFGARLSGRWDGERIFTVNNKTQIFRFGLALDHGHKTWSLALLESKKASAEASSTRTWYSEPVSTDVMVPPAYATLIPERSRAAKKDSKTALAEAGKAHRALFTLLLDRKIVLDQNWDDVDQNVGGRAENYEDRHLKYKVTFLADIIAYADYYGCTSSIASKVGDLLWKLNYNNILMKDVAYNSALYLGLAQQLQHKELFAEAMKHYASKPEHFRAQYRQRSAAPAPAEQLSEQVLSLAVAKNRAILTLTFNLEASLLDILKTNVTGGLFQKADKDEQKKSRAEYLALGCIADYLLNGSLGLNGTLDPNYLLPVRHSSYQMNSAPEIRTGRFYRDLMYTMQKAIDTGDFKFLGRSKPQNMLSQLFLLSTKKTKVEYALKGYLTRMEEEISKVVVGRVGGSPAKWQFDDDSYFFTNVEISDPEFPWSAYEVPGGVST